MSNVLNDPKELQKIQLTLDLISQSGNNEMNSLMNLIEGLKNSGKLEPENHEQLVSSEYLGSQFQAEIDSAYNEQIKKMQQFLSQLEQKLNEYLQIS